MTILRLELGLSRSIQGLELGGTEASKTLLLVISQPGLLGLAEGAPGQEVGGETDDDAHKGDGVHEVDAEAEDAGADDDTPEVGGQQGDVIEAGRGHAQEERHERVEQAQAEGEPDEVACDVAVPGGILECRAVKDGALDTIDDDAEEADEGQHVVHGCLGDEPLLEDVTKTVASGTKESEKIALDHVLSRTTVASRNVVGTDEDAHTANADNDTDDLEDAVADLEEEERDDDHADNRPEVDELRGQDVGVPVGQDGEVVALHVEERHDEILPAVLPRDDTPGLGPLLDHEDGGVDEEEEHIVEDILEGGDAGALSCEQGAKGVGGRDAESEDLADSEDDPEVGRGEVGPPVDRLGLEDVDALTDGSVFGSLRRRIVRLDVTVGSDRVHAILEGGSGGYDLGRIAGGHFGRIGGSNLRVVRPVVVRGLAGHRVRVGGR